jgi:hypothetical protein
MHLRDPHVHVGQVLARLDVPEDSHFYKSSFEEDSADGSSDGGSGWQSTVTDHESPHMIEVDGSPRSMVSDRASVLLASPPQAKDLPTSSREKEMRWFLTHALKAMTEDKGNGSDTAPQEGRGLIQRTDPTVS